MKINLPNVKYYIISDKFNMIYIQTKTNIFYSSININVGSIHEELGQQGLAHFFEHMIFKGTKNFTSQDILLTLDSIGANYNASTSYEQTEYYISGKTSDYGIILTTLLDIFLNPIFPQEDIINEINVVLEELRMNQDNPNKLTIFKLMELIYSQTDPKYSIPVIGLESDINNLTRDNLLKFHSKYINGVKTLSVIGSIDEEDIFSIIKSTLKLDPLYKFEVWKPEFKKLESKLTVLFDGDTINPQCKIIKSPQIKQTLVFIGFRSISEYSKWVYVSDIIENILTGGMTSRLFVLLRNKLGLTYYQNSFNKTFKSHGFFCISYGVQPSGLETSLVHVLKEVLNFGLSNITNKELSKAKNTLETSILFNLETPSNLGSNIIDYVVSNKDPNQIKKIHSQISKVTQKHIIKFAKKIFTKSNIHIVINGSNKIKQNQVKNLIKLI